MSISKKRNNNATTKNSSQKKPVKFKSAYDHVFENGIRTFFLILLFPLALYALLLAVSYGLIVLGRNERVLNDMFEVVSWTGDIILFLSMSWILIVFWIGDRIILTTAAALPVEKKENPRVYRIVENMALATGMPTPKINIIEDESLNAFATGTNPKKATIVLTTGLIKRLKKPELEGVIAHEMAHIKNNDIRLMVIAIAGINIFALLGEIIVRICVEIRGELKGIVAIIYLVALIFGIILLIFGYLIAPLIRLATSRRREFQADATAVLITRNPEALISALKKITKDPRVESLDAMPSMALMCVANPLGDDTFHLSPLARGIFSTHPPIEKRIKALREMSFSG